MIKSSNTKALRLIHNRPGPGRCENAWYRYVTSQQRTGPENRRLWVSRKLRPLSTPGRSLFRLYPSRPYTFRLSRL
jgi:hypothetical protein